MVPWLIRTIGNSGFVPPPTPPVPTGPSTGGGLGWWITEERAEKLRQSIARVDRAEGASRKERRLAEEQLRRSLESAYRGEDPSVTEAVQELLAPIIKLDAISIDWTPAIQRLDLLTNLVGRLEAIAQMEEQARLEMQRDEQDIEMILLTIV